MALSRAALAEELASLHAGPLALAGRTAADEPGGLREPLNRAFRALGVAESGLSAAAAGDGEEAKAVAAASYFVLDAAVSDLVARMDVAGGGGASAKQKQQIDNVERQRDRAAAEAALHGVWVAGSAAAPIPYAGGIDRADYESRAADPDRLATFFGVRP